MHTTMAQSPLRYDRLMKEIPKHKHAKDAIVASGFSENTARKQAKRVLSSALRHTVNKLADPANHTALSTKQLMSDIVGLSGQEVMDRLKTIANQDKDLGSALKVLIPLAKEHGVAIDNAENSVQVPILNVIVDKAPTPILIEGSVEPV